jgi:probable rRNA maturation factor
MNTINIEIVPGLEIEISPQTMERAALETLEQQSAPDVELTLVLTDDKAIRELNRNFLGKDAPTDVLSFPANETDPETGRRYIGDVIISLPKARQQAEEAGHPVQAEIQLLVIHGVLHLLGHDHAEAEEKSRMWAAQAQALESIGLGKIQIKE